MTIPVDEKISVYHTPHKFVEIIFRQVGHMSRGGDELRIGKCSMTIDFD